ncbi:MAG TPA: anti-sigma factor [Thermoanaerobaculia bacterium]|jgi:anti-sigma factor RsiW|nr:anti-sigma factor [Thermoanaerobaculia bacterium]
MNRIDDTLTCDFTCDTALDLLEPYVDGDLAPAAAARLRSHLESCPACAAELALAERIQRELRSLPRLDCPPEIVERARHQGAEVVPFRLPLSRRRTGLPFRIAAAAALLAFSLGGGALFIRSQQQHRRATEIAQATEQARYALALLGRVSRRTGLDVRDEVLARRVVLPAARSITQSLSLSTDAIDAALEPPVPARGEQP